jgi:hypothetical protein
MKSTADFVTDERPKNWREGILWLSPRNGAPLYSLTAAMSEESTDDPQFYWWEEDVQLFVYKLSADLTAVATTIAIVSGGLMLKPGDMLRVSGTGEAIRVTLVNSDTSINVTRAMGPAGTPAGTAAAQAIATNAGLLLVGSAYREGAPRSIGVSNNPTKQSNLCQIFRDPVEITRTAAATRYRTGDPWKNDRKRAMNKHAIGIERAFWLGTQYETLENGQPLRFTDGVLNRIPAANIKTATAGGSTMVELESWFQMMFAYGSKEKLGWCSIQTMTIINQIIRFNTTYQWGPNEKEYGMDVKRLFMPAGTLVLTEHPLFGQQGDFLAQDLVVMDTANLKYRYIQDTVLLKNREDQGVDGQCEEYLTECGLEIQLGKTFSWVKGITKAAKDT